MYSDTKKQLCKDGYESTKMVLVKIPDRNGKVHFVVVSNMAEAKKVFPSDYDKQLVQVWNIKDGFSGWEKKEGE